MDASKFIRSWPALRLWQQLLHEHVVQHSITQLFTFQRGRLDLHLANQTRGASTSTHQLSWSKQGNQATLALMKQPNTPRKRVNVLRKLPRQLELQEVLLHASDRLLKLVLSESYTIILGCFPAVLNVYVLHHDQIIESFLKQAPYPTLKTSWLSVADPLPLELPGGLLRPTELQQALQAMYLDPQTLKLSFEAGKPQDRVTISTLTTAVLRHGSSQRQSPQVAIQRTGRTLLKRWRSKVKHITAELDETHSLPVLELQLQGLQMAQAVGLTPNNAELILPAELAPTGAEMHLALKSGVPLPLAIAATAKRIRKLKGKPIQLQAVLTGIQRDIKLLTGLLEAGNSAELKRFLQAHGEFMDAVGHQQTERKPYKRYTSPSGFDILVGRSSQDNDTLTFKVAGKYDWWFHARQIHGSHVILKTGKRQPEQSDILAAARYAALNSKAKHAGIVVVQYCQRKHLSKPKGGSPGQVLVYQEQSITLDLDQMDR